MWQFQLLIDDSSFIVRSDQFGNIPDWSSCTQLIFLKLKNSGGIQILSKFTSSKNIDFFLRYFILWQRMLAARTKIELSWPMIHGHWWFLWKLSNLSESFFCWGKLWFFYIVCFGVCSPEIMYFDFPSFVGCQQKRWNHEFVVVVEPFPAQWLTKII